MKRKAKSVRMWSLWWPGDTVPIESYPTRREAERRRGEGFTGLHIVRVELRRMPAKRRKARKK